MVSRVASTTATQATHRVGAASAAGTAARRLVRAWRMALEELGDPADAEAMKQYMKGVAPFFGVKSVARRSVANAAKSQAALSPDLTRDWGFYVAVMDTALDEEERELHYCAVDLLSSAQAKKCLVQLDAEAASAQIDGALRRWVTTKPWWDTVDLLASHVGGAFWQHHTPQMREHMRLWLKSDSLWQQRTAILCQLKQRHSTDKAFLFEACSSLMGGTEFFINKAIGWALRNYARVNAEAVQAFVAQHDERISALSRREALKHIGPGSAGSEKEKTDRKKDKKTDNATQKRHQRANAKRKAASTATRSKR
ncbi:hypothetical protein PTSG_07468 [Salpingoeca rosetta]|uniref:DNA alkylation repair enzyme n=1 Tax=Salpingoeca rosetta (strain ATCC 50818 / BSB-021) TaxID=946362 RepID=F2UIT5_SALR5|nr:uncharacterized protein PTSG_07468 [Salpingoeca rosetta]EGD77134.1 hypothetical protein PTSG_07468 [Salpingoeca rosetta]|eukprot:XP_004990973.1 hypothetical protein PTSG_07468 [Salpingoeca rosetta]